MRVPVHWNRYIDKFELVDEAYSDVEFFDVEYYNPNSGRQSTYHNQGVVGSSPSGPT